MRIAVIADVEGNLIATLKELAEVRLVSIERDEAKHRVAARTSSWPGSRAA